MTINPYGLHDLPAVGGGVPGLPRRGSSSAPPAPRPSTIDDYDLILAFSDPSDDKIVQRVSAWGEIKDTVPIGTSRPLIYSSMSEDGKYLINIYRNASGGEKDFALIDLDQMELLSLRSFGATANTYGMEAAVHSGKGWVMFQSNSSGHICTVSIDDFINAPAGNVLGLPVLEQTSQTSVSFALHPSGEACYYTRSANVSSALLGLYSFTQEVDLHSQVISGVPVGDIKRVVIDPLGNSVGLTHGSSFLTVFNTLYTDGEISGFSLGETVYSSTSSQTPLALYKEDEEATGLQALSSAGGVVFLGGGLPNPNLTGSNSPRGNSMAISKDGRVFASANSGSTELLSRLSGGLAMDNSNTAEIRSLRIGSTRGGQPALYLVRAK